MKQVCFSGVLVVVAAFATAFAWAQGDATAAIANKEKAEPDTVRASDVGKSGGADAKDAPPAWVVSSTGTVARAEAGDIGAMGEIAQGYIGLAMSSNTKSTDEERMAMIQEATKWFTRAASLGHKRSAQLLEKLQKDSVR